MMSTACEDPCLCSCCQIRLRSPECTSYRELRHRFLNLLAVYIIDDQTETVSQVYQRGCDCRTCLGCEYKSCRIFSVTHGERAYLNADLSISNRRAYLQHMRLKNAFFARNKIICIILHERSSLCIFHTCSHNLHQTYHCSCLPVTFSAKSISLLHQTLHGQSRKLL